MTPVFIFSLPRCGSTLLQRLIERHESIATASEPWLLLPLVYALKNEGLISEYAHMHAQTALSEFVELLPGRASDYYAGVRKMTDYLYSKNCEQNQRFFLDKTPRYYNIIPEIEKIYPDAKFIFLFRDPADMLASVLTTWHEGKLSRLYANYRDTHEGFSLLTQGYEILSERSVAVRYEDLVNDPDHQMRRVFEYLELEYVNVLAGDLSKTGLVGQMGDQEGFHKFKSVSNKSVGAWRKVFGTRSRNRFLSHYIEAIDDRYLSLQGYDKQVILSLIAEADTKKDIGVGTLLALFWCKVILFLKPNIWLSSRLGKWTKGKYLS